MNSGTERCNAVVNNFTGGAAFDVVINIQGDEPFIDPQTDLSACRVFSFGRGGNRTLVKKITQPDDLINPNVVKVVFDINYKALYFSRHPIPFLRELNQELLNEAIITTIVFMDTVPGS